MRLLWVAIGLAALSTAALAAPKKTDARPKLAVLDLQAQGGVSKELAASATAIVASELSKLNVFRVISREDLRNMLSFEKERQQLGCEADQACLAEIGGALGVEYLASGSVAKLGSAHVLSLTLNNVKTATVEGRVSETVAGDESALVAAISRASKVLVQPVLQGREGFLLLAVAESGAVVKVDGQIRGQTPLRGKLSLPMGPHLLEVEKAGFVTYSEDVTIANKQALAKNVQLVPSQDFINAYEGREKKLRLGAWISTGVAAAGIGSALLFNQLSAKTESDFQEKRSKYEQGSADTALLAEMQTLHNRGNTQVTLARIGVGVGAVGLALATYFWIAGDDPNRYAAFREAALPAADKSSSLAPEKPLVVVSAVPSKDGGAIGLLGRF